MIPTETLDHEHPGRRLPQGGERPLPLRGLPHLRGEEPDLLLCGEGDHLQEEVHLLLQEEARR